MASKLDIELNNKFKALRRRNDRRADERLANFRRSFVGKITEKIVFGKSESFYDILTNERAGNEEIQRTQDISSVKNLRKTIGDFSKTPYVYDSTIARAMKSLKATATLYHYYSANSHDAAQDRLIFDVPKWAIGYRVAGPLGAGIAILNSFNRSMASERNFYQLGKMNTKMINEYLKMLTGFNHYATNRNKYWIEGEARRAATSIDEHVGASRIEYHNIVTNFHDVYAMAQNVRAKYEPQFVELITKIRAEQKRLCADLVFGIENIND